MSQRYRPRLSRVSGREAEFGQRNRGEEKEGRERREGSCTCLLKYCDESLVHEEGRESVNWVSLSIALKIWRAVGGFC